MMDECIESIGGRRHMRMVQLGDCTLYNADVFDVLPTLADGSIDQVISDPPCYGFIWFEMH